MLNASYVACIKRGLGLPDLLGLIRVKLQPVDNPGQPELPLTNAKNNRKKKMPMGL